MMPIDIDLKRYTKITRGRALALLAKAELTPDKFIAHKDKTYTAKFKRGRNLNGAADRVEQVGGHVIAILKRPNPRFDRGPYVTLRFAVASLEQLGIDRKRLNTGVPHKRMTSKKARAPRVSPAVAARDVQALAAEALALAQDGKHDQLGVILAELKLHADALVKTLG